MCHMQVWLIYPKSTCPKTSIFWIKTSKIKGMFVTHQREEWIGSGLWGMRARIQHLKNNYYAYMNGMCAPHLSSGRKQEFDYTCSLVFSRCTSSATFQNPQPLTQKDKQAHHKTKNLCGPTGDNLGDAPPQPTSPTKGKIWWVTVLTIISVLQFKWLVLSSFLHITLLFNYAYKIVRFSNSSIQDSKLLTSTLERARLLERTINEDHLNNKEDRNKWKW